jgi:hypothetical protein
MNMEVMFCFQKQFCSLQHLRFSVANLWCSPADRPQWKDPSLKEPEGERKKSR